LAANNGKRSLAIIPCYNEQLTIASVISKSKRFVDDVLVIDDGSKDNTAKIAKAAGAKVITHNINKGKSAGIKSGFMYALQNRYDYVITLDGDAQHNPDEIPLLLNNLKSNGNDIILGVRFGRTTEMPTWRKFGKRVLDYATSLGAGGLVTDSQCGFRAFNKKAIENMVKKLNGKAFSVESEQLIRAHETGLNIGINKISCKYKDLDTSTQGPTAHGFSVLTFLMKHLIIKRPLLFLGFPGLIMLIFGLILSLQYLLVYDQVNIFNIGYFFLLSTLLITGTIAITSGLVINRLPTLLKKINYKFR